MRDSLHPASARFLPLTAQGLRRRYLLVVPVAEILAARDARLAALGPTAEGEGAPARRLAESVLAEVTEQAARTAIAELLHHQQLATAAPARVETIAAPPADDLILRAEIPLLPVVEAPDLTALRIERLLARLDARDTDRAVADLAARHAAWRECPPGTRAGPAHRVFCDIAATLLPARNHIPQPGVAGARPGAPPPMPETWSFGDNGAGLMAEILAVEPDAYPPHIRLRVRGRAPRDGQSYVIFHLPGAIAAGPDTAWVGSVAVRPVGRPIGLRGCKLRLHSQAASGEGSLRRKDAGLTHPGGDVFERCYVSESFPDPDTAFLRMPLLFDHAAGPVDFRCDIGSPRLVEGLDLGDDDPTPLQAFSGEGLALGGGAADPAGLVPRLAGRVAGETAEIVLRLPDTLPDRALARREARFVVRVRAVRERVVPVVDDEFASRLGFAGLDALRAALHTRLAERNASLQLRQLRQAALEAVLSAGGDFELPSEAVEAEAAALWPRLVAQADARGEAPSPAEATALATRRLRLGLLLAAIANSHGLAPDEAARRRAAAVLDGDAPAAMVEARALEDVVVAHVLARAVVVERVVTGAELAAMQV